MNKKEAWDKLEKEMELQTLGGIEAFRLYKRNIMSLESLRDALMHGYTVRQLENMYEKFLNIDHKTYIFDDVITLITKCKIRN